MQQMMAWMWKWGVYIYFWWKCHFGELQWNKCGSTLIAINKPILWSIYIILGHLLKDSISYCIGIGSPMFITTLFTMTKKLNRINFHQLIKANENAVWSPCGILLVY